MEIKFNDFKNIELKVGKVLEVNDHPNADKLYIIKVDTGEKRTIVAGIKTSYNKEELVGKKIIVVCNLEPREIRGIKSEGMLLAVDACDSTSLLTVDRDVKEGRRVS